MRIEAVELRQLEIPMIEPMAAAYGTTTFRQTILVHVLTDSGSGWGECVALNEPLYSPDWSNGEWHVLKEVFVPALLNAGDISAENVASLLSGYKQHHTAKSAIEMAVLDAQLKAESRSLANYFGVVSESVECSFVAGLVGPDELLRTVGIALETGYKMIKLKIAPGNDVERIDLLQQQFPNLALRVDANASYVWEAPDHRKALEEVDDRGLKLIEQPFHPDRWQPFNEFKAQAKTPIGLDETLTSRWRVINALEMGLCDVLIIKPGMLGGYLVAKELQLEALKRGVQTMVGGMIETAIARAANLALAGSTDTAEYPPEISPDGRWFNDHLNVKPVDMIDGRISVPTEPGLCGELDWFVMDKLTRRFHVARTREQF